MTLLAILIGGFFSGCLLWSMVSLFNEKWWKE